MGNNSPIEGIDWTCGAAALRLEDGRTSGTGGINRLMGDYWLVGEFVTFGPVATTMMAGRRIGWKQSDDSSGISRASRAGRSWMTSSYSATTPVSS